MEMSAISLPPTTAEPVMSMQQISRPLTLPDLLTSRKLLITPEGMRSGLAYQPGASDVFIVTPSKCGTTWMQQIVHGLRTRGDMDFGEITAVVPWLEVAFDMGIDIKMPQVAAPRAFKTHRTLAELPKGAKYIVVLRDPADAFLSLYHFFSGWLFEPGRISVEELARGMYFVERRYWSHVSALFERRGEPHILPLCFEDLKADLPAAVERIARFIGIPLDPQLKQIVVSQSDIAFMRAHGAKFDDHLVREARNSAMGLPAHSNTSKIRSGNVGESTRELPKDLMDEFASIWKEEIANPWGIDSYEALRRELASFPVEV